MYCMKTVPRKKKKNRDALLVNQKQYGQQQRLVPVVCLFWLFIPLLSRETNNYKKNDPF